MSKIQRYRINPVAWEDGKGWVRQSIHSKPKVHAIEQPHKKGGWCKWEDVKDLEAQLAEAREAIKNLNNLERQRWGSASKAFGIKGEVE